MDGRNRILIFPSRYLPYIRGCLNPNDAANEVVVAFAAVVVIFVQRIRSPVEMEGKSFPSSKRKKSEKEWLSKWNYFDKPLGKSCWKNRILSFEEKNKDSIRTKCAGVSGAIYVADDDWV